MRTVGSDIYTSIFMEPHGFLVCFREEYVNTTILIKVNPLNILFPPDFSSCYIFHFPYCYLILKIFSIYRYNVAPIQEYYSNNNFVYVIIPNQARQATRYLTCHRTQLRRYQVIVLTSSGPFPIKINK